MAFYCQQDSYATELLTEVVSCTPAKLTTEQGGKKETLTGYNVILNDTVLFPEGGGQPDDRGFIGEVPVLRVTRQGPDAVHFVSSPLEVGAQVLARIDWQRRFDHMQQHSGQHLITAIADSLYNFKTTSWELGRQRSSIELDTPTVTSEQVDTIEQVVNQKIRQHIPVTVKINSTSELEDNVRSRGLPEDHAGPVRIIDIEGVDANMCCGTHVANLSDLQVIKLLGTEKGKKNKTNLIFIAGERVLKYTARSYSVEKSLTSLLKNGPEEHIEAVEKLQKSVKSLQKNNLTLLRDLAVLVSENFKNSTNKGKLFSLHRKDGDNEFMNIIANEIGTDCDAAAVGQHLWGTSSQKRTIIGQLKKMRKRYSIVATPTLRRGARKHFLQFRRSVLLSFGGKLCATKELIEGLLPGNYAHINKPGTPIKLEGTVVFLTVGDEKASGLFLLAGPSDIINNLGPRVCKILDGKGAGKNGRFQGKANKMSQRGEAEKLLEEFVNNTTGNEN